MDWMRLPAPKQEGLARDKPRGECALGAAPIPGIEMIVQKTMLLKPAGWVGRSVYFLCLILIASCVLTLSKSNKSWIHVVVQKLFPWIGSRFCYYQKNSVQAV